MILNNFFLLAIYIFMRWLSVNRSLWNLLVCQTLHIMHNINLTPLKYFFRERGKKKNRLWEMNLSTCRVRRENQLLLTTKGNIKTLLLLCQQNSFSLWKLWSAIFFVQNLYYILFIQSVCMCVRVCLNVCHGAPEVVREQLVEFFPSNTWVSGINLSLLSLVTSTLTC